MTATFNITSGFNSLESVHKMKDAGATELYGGFLPENINAIMPTAFQILNRRGEDANFSDWNEFKKAVEQSRKYNMPVYVTFNGLYIEKQYKLILSLIKEVSSLKGVKGIIVNDIALLLLLQDIKYDKEVVISTGGTTFNADTVAFYKSLGAKRIILDRQLSIKEIINIISADTFLEYEVFMIGGSCLFIDGFCSFFHCSEKIEYKNKMIRTYNVKQYAAGCNLLINNIINNKSYYEKKYKAFQVCPSVFLSNSQYVCNLCNLYDLRKLNDISLKVVNRKNATDTFVKVVKQAVDRLKTVQNKKEYIKYCKKILKENNLFVCNENQCYYK